MDFSPEALRAHWEKLTEKADAYHAKRDPLNEELGKLVAGDTKLSVKAAQKREAEIRDQIKKLQAAHFPIENERAAVARALGGKTGPV
jgi:seryl-tRNA synthetase